MQNLFGQFTPFKGADVLIEAMATLPPEVAHLRVHGANEAVELRDGDPDRFHGKGVIRAKFVGAITARDVLAAVEKKPPPGQAKRVGAPSG